MESIRADLGLADYLSFVLLMAVSTVIGIYFAYRDRNEATTKNYFFGGKQMHPVAVGLSLAVTFQSAVVVIAAPAETYLSGTLMMWEALMRILSVPIVFAYVVPLYHRLQLRTVFEYLELRFSSTLRRILAGLLSTGMIFYVGTVLYLPAVAVNAVTSLPLAWSIVITGVIATFYTTLGGMKAVIWTDVLQSGIMILGMVAVLIKGLIVIGGFDELYDSLERGGRFTASRFDYGIISRLSPIGIIVGGFFMGLGGIGIEQSIIQRFQSCETVSKAQSALLVYILPTLIITITSVGNGLIMYAFYEGCDPVKSGKIESIDQGISYMTLEIFQSIPGMTGLFISSIFSASLSTISSCLNSLSVLILEDLIAIKWPSMSDRVKVTVGKILGVILGVVLISMAFAISASGSNVFELLYGFTSLTYGPGIAIYFLGFFFPWTNTIGAMTGLFSSYAVLVFMFVGRRFFNDPPYPTNLPGVSTEFCQNNLTENFQITNLTTELPLTSSAIPEIERTFLRDVYNINYNFLMMIGFIITIIVGIIASFLSGHTPASKADPRLFVPLVDNKRLSLKVLKFFRFGVPNLLSESTKQYRTANKNDVLIVETNDI
uniref:sodium-coupled monocarboxylate transporter 1-like n=1 Tax=Styela clava TaxID=7725 RepID=UPI001939F4CA|nr:sodium-coupled monocarboxylate transporter 1-like [Styela clava]